MLPCQRHAFSLPPDLHYLNCAYMSPLPRAVEAAGMEGIRRKRVPADIRPEAFFDEADRARGLFASLLGSGNPSRIAIVPSVSYAVAVAARNLPVRRGGNIVVVHEQFPSNVYAWMRVCRDAGADFQVVRPPEAGANRGAAWNERLLEAVTPETCVVAVPHVHWTDGTRFDLEALSARAREVGAALVVDGTQSIGAMPFDFQAIQPDLLVCAAYKWLLGPYGIGLAYFGDRFDEGVPNEENWIARKDSRRFDRLVDYQDAYEPGAIRYDVGERSNFILMPMLVAALELVLAWTPREIQAYCRELTEPALAELGRAGFLVETPDRRGSHLFGIRLPRSLPVQQVADRLRERAVSVSIRGDSVRVAPHVYNTPEDLSALSDTLLAVVSA